MLYSDSSSFSECTYDDASTLESCFTSSPLALEEAVDGFFDENTVWFLQVQEIWLCIVILSALLF